MKYLNNSLYLYIRKKRSKLKSLRGIPKAKVKCAVNKVNSVLKKIDIRNLTELNNTMYAAAAYVTELVGANKLQKTKKEPWWKRKLEGKLKELNPDLDFVNNLLEKRNIKKKHKDRLERRYNIRRKRLNIVREEMKQGTKAVGTKIKRFNSRINQYQQNWMFVNNQGRFFLQLNNEEENHPYEIPNSVEAQTFWRDIWSERKEHHKDAEWLKDVKKDLEQDEGQDKIDITKDKIMRVMRNMTYWKAPGPDNVQGYWLKNLTPLHDKLVVYLLDCLDSGVVPDWLTKARTVLIQKDKAKGNIACNYRPITCLPLAWKLLTGILADEIYDYLEKKMLLPEEQKGYRQKCKGTGDLLFIDKMILWEVRIRKKNLAVAWIDYKKAHDMVPHPWIVKCLGMVGVSEQIKHFLFESMKAWRVDLTCIMIFSDDTGMEFGIDKCATIVLKRGEITKFDGISLPDERVIKRIN